MMNKYFKVVIVVFPAIFDHYIYLEDSTFRSLNNNTKVNLLIEKRRLL